MANKVYTKKGDTGFTSIMGLRKIPKSANRIETIGSIDELNSYVGMIRYFHDSETMESIQNSLFDIGGCLADFKGEYKCNLDTQKLETEMDQMSRQLAPLKNFILPGGNQPACYCHLARSVCRRAERDLVKLNSEIQIQPEILQYINRLSDYFFVLARYVCKLTNTPETIWTGSN